MALVNPNIAMSFRMPEFTPRNALAEYAQIQQIQSGQRQAEVADMQLAQLRQKEKAISDIQAKAAQGGGPTDRRAIARAYIQSGNPEFMQFGLTMETTLDELDAFKNIMGTGGGRGGATAAPAAPAAEMGLPAGAQPPGDFTSTEAMGRVPGVVTSPIPDSPPMNAAMPAQANALAPAQPAPTNALANPVAALRAKRDQLIALGTPRAIQAARSMDSDIALMSRESRMYTVPGVGLVDPTGRVVKPSAVTPTDLQRNYEFARTPEGGGFKGSFADFKVLSTPKTTITNVQEKAEAGEFGKLLVGQFDAISKQASVAARTLPSIEANLATLNKGLDTGFGTDAKAAGARVLGALGVKDAEKFATDTQTFQSNAISAVLQKQLEQKGPQTESDARRIEQIGVELGKTKDANRFILDLAREQLRRDIEQRNFYTEWKKGPGKGSFNGAEDAWFAGEGGKSLFDRPALKKYAVGAASPAAQIPTAATPARAAPAPAAAPANVITNPQFPGFSIRKP
jgi:hypothetical protein